MKFRILFLFLLVLSCTKKTTTSDTLLYYLPQDAAVIIKVNSLSNFKSELKNSEFFTKSKNTSLYNTITKKVNGINFLNPNSKCLIGFYELGKGKFEFLFASDYNPDFFSLQDVGDKTVETLTYENREIKKYKIDTNILYAYQIDDKIIVSSSQILLENFVRTGRNEQVSKKLTKLYNATDDKKSASILINLKNGENLLSGNLKNEGSSNLALLQIGFLLI